MPGRAKTQISAGPLAIAACSLATFFSGAFIFGYPGLMAPYWQHALGATAAETGCVLTVVVFTLGLLMSVGGVFHARRSTRATFLVGTAALIAGMLILNLTQSMGGVYAWAITTGVACSFLYGPALTVAQHWYPRNRGLVCGIVNLIFGLSGALTVPLMHAIFDAVGYHALNWVLMGCIILLNVPLTLIVRMPSVPATAPSDDDATLARDAQSRVVERPLTPLQAVRTRRFWLVWGSWCTMGAAGVSMIALAHPVGVHTGVSGVLILTVFNLANGFSRIIVGPLSDRVSPAVIAAVTYVAAGAAYAILPYVRSAVMVSLVAALVGTAFGTLFTVTAPLGAQLFGLRHFGVIFGLIFTGYGIVGGIAGPLASSALLDASGSVHPVGVYLAVCAVVGAACVWAAGRKRV